tara:strand:- start:3404 stop:3685 length:282 start_codon:yes stop_codon:yes gene_type:complete
MRLSKIEFKENTRKVYKILHTPTGLYFNPNVDYDKTNLDLEGKLYFRKPDLPELARIEVISKNNNIETGHTWFNHTKEKNSSNWEIKTYIKHL